MHSISLFLHFYFNNRIHLHVRGGFHVHLGVKVIQGLNYTTFEENEAILGFLYLSQEFIDLSNLDVAIPHLKGIDHKRLIARFFSGFLLLGLSDHCKTLSILKVSYLPSDSDRLVLESICLDALRDLPKGDEATRVQLRNVHFYNNAG
jgi:hypothetical protein